MHNQATILTEKFYRVKITNYGNNGEASFWYDEPLHRAERRESQLYPLIRTKSQDLNDQLPDPDSETNEERAMRRAKSKVRKLVMTMKADRLLTLTVRENLTCRLTANKLFVRFIKLVHRKYPNYKYVSVAEVQKRGAWHFHMAVSGFQDLGYLRHCWTALVDGNINVTSPKTCGNKNNASPLISSYITKYMTKAFLENHETGKYRYRASNGIELQQAIFWIKSQTWAEAQKDAGNLIQELYGSIGSFYFSEDWNNGWFASWSLSTKLQTNKFKAKRITS